MLQSYSLLVLAWQVQQKTKVRRWSAFHRLQQSQDFSCEMNNCDNMAQALHFLIKTPVGLNRNRIRLGCFWKHPLYNDCISLYRSSHKMLVLFTLSHMHNSHTTTVNSLKQHHRWQKAKHIIWLYSKSLFGLQHKGIQCHQTKEKIKMSLCIFLLKLTGKKDKSVISQLHTWVLLHSLGLKTPTRWNKEADLNYKEIALSTSKHHKTLLST